MANNMTTLRKILLSLGLSIWALGSAAMAQNAMSSVILNNVSLKPNQQNILTIDASQLPNLRSDAPVVLQFESLKTDTPLSGYFEVYLVAQDPNEAVGRGQYVGNLNFFGTDNASMLSSGNRSVNQTIDISQAYSAAGGGIDFENKGVALVLKPVVTSGAQMSDANIGRILVSAQ